MPKIVDKEQMRQEILDASLNAFLKYGFHKTTMEKIAKEAGIAKGTLYLYFSSKEELTQGISKVHFSKLKARLVSYDYFTTLDELLNHIEDALLINEEETAFIPIFFEAFAPSFHTPAFIKEYKDFFNEIALFYEHNFKALITKNEINPTLNPSALSRAFVSMLDGIVLHKGFFQIENKQYEAMVKESISFFRRGLV
jgi:AcrR family transcriptional regulator